MVGSDQGSNALLGGFNSRLPPKVVTTPQEKVQMREKLSFIDF